MATPTAEEQYLLELINEARLNPYASLSRYVYSFQPIHSLNPDINEALNFYNVSGRALGDDIRALPSVGALAWNDALGTSAESHSAAMIAADVQSHQVDGEDALAARVRSAGYTGSSALGENVYAFGKSVLYAHAGFFVDWGDGANGMQNPAGHRLNIMSANFTEVGLDVTAESVKSTSVGPYVVTEDFGSRGKFFVTGVAYRDMDKDNFYSIGEGVAGLKVAIGATTATSATAGGYSLALTTLGSQAITLSGGGLSGSVSILASVTDANLKLDVVNGNTLLTSGSIAVSGFSGTIKTLGVKAVTISGGAGNQDIRGATADDTLDGGNGDDSVYGGSGNDMLTGGSGNDLLAGEAGNDVIDGGDGVDTVYTETTFAKVTVVANRDGSFMINGERTGTDTVRNVEFFRFTDGQYRWNASTKAMELVANTVPVAALNQTVTTSVGVAKQFTIGATDADGDKLTYSFTSALHGNVTALGDGVFSYTPTAQYTGSDSIRVTASDGRGGSVTQSVTFTVAGVNTPPTVSAAQAISVNQNVAKQVTVSATDADGDKLTYVAGTAQHGTVTGGTNGLFTYTPTKGYAGADSFSVTVDDGKGGKVTQTVSIQVSTVQPPSSVGSSSAPFRLFAADGLVETVGGIGTISGTNGFQDITLTKYKGELTFDASFNRGGDIIRVPGAAADYSVVLVGSMVSLISGETKFSIPIGLAGVSLVFSDGVRNLHFDQGANAAKIGSQTITGAPLAITAPTDGTPLPTGANEDARGRVFLSPDADITLGGNHLVFGTTGLEKVHYLKGDLALDGSFNRGGDTLFLPDGASAFHAYLAGSSVILTSAKGEITIPFGSTGIVLDFLGDTRVLRYDVQSGQVMLGSQAITSVNANTPDQIGTSDGISLDVGTLASSVHLDLASGANHTLNDTAAGISNVQITGFDKGDMIHVTGATEAQYSFTNGDADGNGVYGDIIITYSNGNIFNEIALLNAVEHNAYVANAASAKVAFGADFIDFGGGGGASTPTVPGGSNVSLDVGSASTPKEIALDTAAAYTLTDNASQVSNVLISGFTSNDVIHVTGATSDEYSFSNGDADQNGVYGDLIVTLSNDTTVNIIGLLNVLASNAMVFDAATAQNAMGSEFITFG